MLLRWVLTRDIASVLGMADDYGMVLVEGNRVTRVQPKSWDDVARAYSIDESLPEEEKLTRVVVKSEDEIIPAEKKIYSALRRGELDSWARPNGSAGVVQIGPVQWTGLRFYSFYGRDIAIPIDSEYNPLPLPRELSEYLAGSVPATSTPPAWPDPLFSADQAMKLWPPHEGSAAKLTPQANPFMRTGAPGRPSKGIYLIRIEFDRRQVANECKPSLRKEAEELEKWFCKNYSTAQPVKRKTIENNIRSKYREWAADRLSAERQAPKL